MAHNKSPEDLYPDEVNLLIDTVVEWLAMKWTKSMIYAELRSYFPRISIGTCQAVLTKAKKRILERYNISPEDYKGEQIALYEAIIRGKKFKRTTKEVIAAAERLDKLLGLEHISSENPEDLVQRILEFKKAAVETVGGQLNEETNTNDKSKRNRKDGSASRTDKRQNKIKSSKSTKGSNSGDDQLTPEQLVELTNPKPKTSDERPKTVVDDPLDGESIDSGVELVD